MTSNMEVDPKEEEEKRVALHPLTIVHMSDQYTRISCGGSPLATDAPVVGLLFGDLDEAGVLQIRDADEIPTEISDTTTLQVDLHKAVFPQHSVVGWYRVSNVDDEPTSEDLRITESLKAHYAPPSESSAFHFCLLRVENQDVKPSVETETPGSTLSEELPINLYELHSVEGNTILLGLQNWQLETSEPERIAVERVMKEQPQKDNTNIYVSETVAMQHSLLSMEDRVQVLVQFLEKTQNGSIPPDYSLLRQVQGLMYSLGPLSVLASQASQDSFAQPTQDAELLSHLTAVAKTVSAVQSYTDKFRVIHESKAMTEKMRRMF